MRGANQSADKRKRRQGEGLTRLFRARESGLAQRTPWSTFDEEGPFLRGGGRGVDDGGEIQRRGCLNTNARSRDGGLGAGELGPGEREMNNIEPLIWQAYGTHAELKGYSIRPPFTEQLNQRFPLRSLVRL